MFKEEVRLEEVLDLSMEGQVVEEGRDVGRSPVGSREIPSLEDLPEGAELITDDGFSTPENPGLRLRSINERHFIIDARDWALIKGYKWYVRSDGGDRLYVTAWANNKKAYLHRVIMGARGGEQVDHKFGTTCDNRLYNLRIATPSQNAQNRRKKRHYKGKPCSSEYKGVDYFKSLGKWRARIRVNGRTKFLGYFNHPVEAAMAYDEAAREYHEFPCINF